MRVMTVKVKVYNAYVSLRYDLWGEFTVPKPWLR